ncbi:hypothetical protein PAMC26510_23095 [Caballeronia sordidicola]|uniref:Uncharacterized protein n=1 Tax=Caballeronia sordidicola TaxID=196367 RepID=A0A242MK03_CABSO|nr:hypothetical protein PAMC26510_23095 [Caballeronia sordidicola]
MIVAPDALKGPNAGLANPALHTPNAIELMNSDSLELVRSAGFFLRYCLK